MEYSVEELSNSTVGDWNKLNEENVQGSFYHTLKWKEVIDRFVGKTSYFLVYRNGEAVALCPFYREKWIVKGLFSWGVLKTEDNGNIVLRYPDDPSVGEQIVLKCKAIVRKEGLSYTAITLIHGTRNSFGSMNLLPSPLKGPMAGSMTLDLQEYTPQRIWNSFSKEDRRRVGLPEKRGWMVDEITSADELASFYAYYKANMEHLRANYAKFSQFEYLMQTFMTASSPHEMLVFLLRKNKTVAGGLIVFLFDAKKTMYYAFVSLNRKVPNRYSPVYTLFWHGIEKASEMGYSKVEFGGTHENPESIHYRIKEKFGCRFERRYCVSFPKSRVLLNSALDRLTAISRLVS